MRKLFEIGGPVAAAVLIAVGLEQIVGSPDMTPELPNPGAGTPGDPDHMSGDRLTTGEQFPAAGLRVELDRHVYGHAAGAQGVVVRGHAKGTGKVLVRFDRTGYHISVPRHTLRRADF